MSRQQTAARRYAEAAFEVGRADGTLERWESDLATIGSLVEHPDLRAVLDHPGVDYATKERIVRRAAAGVSPEALNLVLLMVRRGRPRSVPAMIEHFAALMRRQRGIARAEIRTPVALDAAEEAAIAERLRHLAGGEVELRVVIDPTLIGGVAVRIGDQLYDGTVRSRLERLRARLTAA
jgi:F-type H+-transporting ATPase subunit delta